MGCLDNMIWFIYKGMFGGGAGSLTLSAIWLVVTGLSLAIENLTFELFYALLWWAFNLVYSILS